MGMSPPPPYDKLVPPGLFSSFHFLSLGPLQVEVEPPQDRDAGLNPGPQNLDHSLTFPKTLEQKGTVRESCPDSLCDLALLCALSGPASFLFRSGLVWSHTWQLSVSEHVFSSCLICGIRMAQFPRSP